MELTWCDCPHCIGMGGGQLSGRSGRGQGQDALSWPPWLHTLADHAPRPSSLRSGIAHGDEKGRHDLHDTPACHHATSNLCDAQTSFENVPDILTGRLPITTAAATAKGHGGDAGSWERPRYRSAGAQRGRPQGVPTRTPLTSQQHDPSDPHRTAQFGLHGRQGSPTRLSRERR